jgi:hypothetical protein
MSDDRFDANPYQSPEWSPADDERVGGQHGSGTLPETIHIKGSLSLDDVLRAYPAFIRNTSDLVVWCFLLTFQVVLVGCASVFFWHQAVQHSSSRLFAVGAMVMMSPLPSLGVFLWQLRATRRVKRLWEEQGGVFQYREVTITDETIEIDSAHGTFVTKTPWTDYAVYRRHRDTIRLHMRRRGIKNRREQRRTKQRPSRFEVNLQKIDIFPRHQFENADDWERFLRMVKHKLWRRW